MNPTGLVTTKDYAVGTTYTYSTGYGIFFNTAIHDTTTCVLGNCYLKATGCSDAFAAAPVDVTDYYQVAILSDSITIGLTSTWAITAEQGWVNGYKKEFCF
jgi:hypothetical protein